MRKAFAIGTKIKESYTEETVAKVKRERVDRIAAVVETPCLIDRLVEFVADKDSNELLITEASVCLAAVVCSDNYNEEQIDEGEMFLGLLWPHSVPTVYYCSPRLLFLWCLIWLL